MSSVESLLTGGVLGVAIGGAASSALDPVFEPVKQSAWSDKPSKILDEAQLAQLVAEALNTVSDVIDDVNRNGYDSDQFASLVQLALKAPGPPDAEKLYLRAQGNYPGAITLAQLHHAYGKAGIEGQWWEALTAAAQSTLLTPAELALAVVRSTVQDNGLLVVTLDTSDSNVPKYPVAALDTLAEFAAAGVNAERARVMVGAIGLPMSTQQAASAYFRDILTLGAFNQSVLEGDVRPEWAPFILEQARQILTAHEYAELNLRGWITTAQAYAGAALHGMSQSDAQLLIDNTGRPIALHQVTTGLERGGVWDGTPQLDIPEPYLKMLQESNIRQEWFSLAYANRYTYPGYFVLKPLVQSGAISVDQATSYLLFQGWEPELAALTAVSFAATTAATSSRVKSAQTKLVTSAEKAYINGASTVAQATEDLTVAEVAAGDIPTILAAWNQIIAIESRTTTTSGVIAPPSGG